MVAQRQAPANGTSSAKALLRREVRKIYSRERVRSLLLAERILSQAEAWAWRMRKAQNQHRDIPFNDGTCLSITTNKDGYRYQFLANPRQRNNPELLTRDESQNLLAIKEVLLE